MTPLLRRLLAVYAILALAVIAYPGGLVSWLEDRNRDGRLDKPLALMHGIDAASSAIGLKQVGQGLRAKFRALVGDDQG